MMLWSVQSICISPYFHSHCLVQAEADGVYVFPEEHGTEFRAPRATLCPSVTHRSGYFSTRGSSSAEGFGRAIPAETPAPTVPTAHTGCDGHMGWLCSTLLNGVLSLTRTLPKQSQTVPCPPLPQPSQSQALR